MGPLEGNTEDEAKARDFFNIYDLNGDALITCDELEKMMKDMGVDFDRSCLNKLMTILDVDNSKAMEFDEFLRLCKGSHRA